MKTCKKMLCMLLSVIMALSCFSMVSFAAGESFTYSMKHYAEKTNEENAKALLDEIDALLNDAGIYEEIEIASIKIVIDLTSVDGLCETIDLLDKFWGTINGFLGDLDDINLRVWENGMSRKSHGDEKILYEIIELVTSDERAPLRDKNNAQAIGGLLDGEADLGVLNRFLSINDILGEEGISGIIKKALISTIFPENTPEFEEAYAKYKNNIDAFIYDELINDLFAETFLPGFKVDATTNIEDVLINAFNLSLDKYLVDIIKNDLHVNLSDNGADGAALAPYINLDGKTYDLSGVKLDQNKPLLDQVNNVIGIVAQQMIPGYAWVESDDYTMITSNLEGVMKHLGKASGLIPDADSLSFNEISMQFVEILLRNLKLGEYDFIKECKTLEDMATAALVKLSGDLGTGVVYGEDADYLVVIGDIFAWWFYDNFNITDLNGKAYRAGGGKDCFEVANYFLNYFLFDKGAAGALGLKTTKQESAFTKIDKLLDYCGKDKSTGVSFNSKNFMLGTGSKKGLLDALFSLDLQAILDLTVVPAINTAGNVSLVEFLYKTVYNMLKNWAGAELLPAYQTKAFTNSLSNANISKLLTNALLSVGAKRESLLDVAYFTCGLLFKPENGETVAITELKAEDLTATGDVLVPKVTVKAGGKTLVNGKDYVVKATASAPGEYTATVKGIGLYSGSNTVNYAINMGKVDSVAFASETNTVKLQWAKVPYADGYNIYRLNGSNYELIERVSANEYYVAGLTPATAYTFKVEAVSNTYGTTEGAVVSVASKPLAVSGNIKSYVNHEAVKLLWSPVENVTGYIIEVKKDGNWVEAGKTDKTDIIVSGLKPFTTYEFRISSYKEVGNKNVTSDPVSYKARTNLGAVKTIKAVTSSSTAITVQWSKIEEADGYFVYQKINGQWKKIATLLGNNKVSYKKTGLKANTIYDFGIIPAAYDENNKVVNGSAKTCKGATGLTVPTGLKVTATNATQARLQWNKLSGASGYQVFVYKNKKWTAVGMTTNNYMIVSGLPSGTNNYFRIRAVRKIGSVLIYGDPTAEKACIGLTLPGKVTGVKMVDRNKTAIKLQWNKVTGAKGYQIFRLYNGKWVSLGMTTNNYWIDSKSLTRNTEYQYRVRAVQVVGKTYKYGTPSDILKAKTAFL